MDLTIPDDLPPEAKLRRLLTFWDQLRCEAMPADMHTWRYATSHGMMQQVGTVYHPQPLPPHVKPMTIKQCFTNSWYQAVINGLTYVEGYGYNDLGMAVHHAWNVDGDGRVLDFTWRWTDDPDANHLYTGHGILIGVPVPDDLLHAVWQKREYVGVIADFEHGFPALRLGWDPPTLRDFYDALPAPGKRKRQKRASRKRSTAVVP